MPVIAKGGENTDFEKAPLGTQPAVCSIVADIGTHINEYQGEQTKAHKIVICWELAEKMKDGDLAGNPFMVSKFYTLSLHKKANLRADLENWRGKGFTDAELVGFDVEKLIGVNCLLNVVKHIKGNGDEARKVGAIMPAIKGSEPLDVCNATTPEWITKIRNLSLEMVGDGDGIVDRDNFAPQDGLPF